MTNVNDLNQKLDDLFDDMQLEPTPPIPAVRPISWSWECDHQGFYTKCSPEVWDILGIKPDNFLGKPMSSYMLTPQSSRKLEVLLGTLTEETQINVNYQNDSGFSLSIRMTICLSHHEDPNEQVLYGINKIISSQ
jgi:hypothetical protein